MAKEKRVHVKGECPKCSMELEYSGDGLQTEDYENYYYDVLCPACGWEGREWVELKFTGFTDAEGESVRDVYDENEEEVDEE